MAIHEGLLFQECLPIPYHQQDVWNYCGAACSQMVLAGLGSGILCQSALFDEIGHHDAPDSKPWWAAPDGIRWALNNHPIASSGTFEASALASVEAISRKIVWSIHSARLPAVAFTGGGQHWIVVRGYQASSVPLASDDACYSIFGFYINNPCPPASDASGSNLPPPHTSVDGCGSGGKRGVRDEHLCYTQWADTYMKLVSSRLWNGFVAVCSPAVASCATSAIRPVDHYSGGERILPHEEIVAQSLKGLKNYGLTDRNGWKESLAATTPGTPKLVQRLDRTDKFYYIVPMESGPGVAPMLVCVDALSGDYLQAVNVPDLGGNALSGLSFDPQKALASVLGKRFSAGTREGWYLVRPEACSVYPTLVWKMCRESRSPYYPFFMITVGNRRLYVRVDGKVFTRLDARDWNI